MVKGKNNFKSILMGLHCCPFISNMYTLKTQKSSITALTAFYSENYVFFSCLSAAQLHKYDPTGMTLFCERYTIRHHSGTLFHLIHLFTLITFFSALSFDNRDSCVVHAKL